MSIFHKPIKIRRQMQNTICTRFAYRRIIMQGGFPRRWRVFHRAFPVPFAPLYFAKFTFSEIICFAKCPSPRPAVLRRAAVSGGIVMAATRSLWFCCSSTDRNLYARRFCAPFVQPCGSCLRVSCVCFAWFDSFLNKFLHPLILDAIYNVPDSCTRPIR